MTDQEKKSLEGKRIGAFDYGEKRVGFAVCDELRIVVSPRGFFENKPDFLTTALAAIEKERLGAVVVGVPYRVDDAVTPLIEKIHSFINELRKCSSLPIFEIDESFSSRRAMETMIASGTRKKRRAQKGRTDAVAAALILREFIEELGYAR